MRAQREARRERSRERARAAEQHAEAAEAAEQKRRETATLFSTRPESALGVSRSLQPGSTRRRPTEDDPLVLESLSLEPGGSAAAVAKGSPAAATRISGGEPTAELTPNKLDALLRATLQSRSGRDASPPVDAEAAAGSSGAFPWVTSRARWVTVRARWVMLRARWATLMATPSFIPQEAQRRRDDGRWWSERRKCRRV
jgi:hypothetical protein